MSNFLPNFEVGLVLALVQVLAFVPWALALGSEAITLSSMRKAARPTVGGARLAGWLAFIPALIASIFGAIGEATGRLLPVARQKSVRQQLLIFVAAVAGLVLLM